jgi:hypothetical protein
MTKSNMFNESQNNKNDITSYINNLLFEIVERYISFSGYYPSRLVMIPMNKCYCCKEQNSDIELVEYHSDDYVGKFHNYGWIVCRNCEIYLKLYRFYYEKKYTNYLPNRLVDFYKKKKFNFWRVSQSNKNLKPYLHKKAFYMGLISGDLFKLSPNIIYETKEANEQRICMCLNWYNHYDYNNNFKKYVPLANVIFYNKDIFGNDFKHLNFTDILCNSKWINLFKKEYQISNNYMAIYKIICLKVPEDIAKIIFNFNNYLHEF